MKRTPWVPDSGKRWLALLLNHWQAIAAMDPTVIFGVQVGTGLVHSRVASHFRHSSATRGPVCGERGKVGNNRATSQPSSDRTRNIRAKQLDEGSVDTLV